MLVANRRSGGARVVASAEDRGGGPWNCPACAAQVSLKKGTIRIHHFAHYPPVSCEYGTGESEEHRRCKTAIYEAMRAAPNTSKWELERSLGSVRPDVSGYVGQTPVAVEVQASSLRLERIAQRTSEYHAKGVYVLWVGIWDDRLLDDRFAPAAWEKWLHTLYFGRVYYWDDEYPGSVVPVHFGRHSLHVEERKWHDEYGDERQAGGYDRISKRLREAGFPRLDAVPITDMTTRVRSPWSGGGYTVPSARLWIDRLPQWW